MDIDWILILEIVYFISAVLCASGRPVIEANRRREFAIYNMQWKQRLVKVEEINIRDYITYAQIIYAFMLSLIPVWNMIEVGRIFKYVIDTRLEIPVFKK